MAIVNFSTNKFQAYAVIQGQTVDIIRIEGHFALNEIPQAQIYCAIGREVTTLNVAEIHYLIDSIDINLPITVRATAVEEANSGYAAAAGQTVSSRCLKAAS